ncbi:MAG TPA: hypothetical protein VNO14_00510, partial [Blastocatellia bacterium]|nr:hypothetical protein [Blastocatellia bacterium]
YFERILREYPRGRFHSDARGWLAYLSLLAGDRVSALVQYYRMLSDKGDLGARLEAAKSLNLVRHRANDSEMKQVEALLEAEPAPALAYAYHNIYNYAPKRAKRYSYETGDDKSKVSELERIAAFSSRLMRRYPALSIGGAFALRMAQACLELDRNREAAEFARRAQKARIDGDERAQALWVEGVAEHRLGNHAAARRALTAILDRYPDGPLAEGARRNLAMVAEDMGDLDAALEQYLALEYDRDVAYFVDVLMTPDQLSAFIDRHPDGPRRDELCYSLALRHLRDGKWGDARRVLSQIRPTGSGIDGRYDFRPSYSYEAAYIQAKAPYHSDRRLRGVRPQWIERDLRTANDLERLEASVNAAQDAEAKAEALYQYASYQYQAGSLLFYNPAMWAGRRYPNLAFLYERGNYRRSNEARLLFDYINSHDVPARALAIYLEIASRYPATRAARDALYTAAVCHEKLANYNWYWRDIYEAGGHAGNRMVSYRDVKAVYPDYALPRGTYGWEPMTRTVNGGPAIKPPPKPVPRPGRRERLLRAASLWFGEMIEGWMSLFDWLARFLKSLWIGFVFSGLVYLWLRASKTRRLLQAELARCPSPPEQVLERPRHRSIYSSPRTGSIGSSARRRAMNG